MKYTYTIIPVDNELYRLRVYEYDETRHNYQGDIVMSQLDSLNNIYRELEYWTNKA